MTRKEILQLNKALNSTGKLSGVRFSYAVSKNVDILKPEIDALIKSVEPSEQYQEYEEKRVEIAKSHAKKNKEGKELVNIREDGNQEYQIKDQKAFEKELKKLQAEHKDAIDGREKQYEEYNKMLEESVDVNLHTIKLNDIPEDITTAQMHSILPMIQDE